MTNNASANLKKIRKNHLTHEFFPDFLYYKTTFIYNFVFFRRPAPVSAPGSSDSCMSCICSLLT